MQSGRVEQIGAPRDLYERPGTPAVRDFLGRIVMLTGHVAQTSSAGHISVTLKSGVTVNGSCAADTSHPAAGESCSVAIRPEKIDIQPFSATAPIDQANTLRGRIQVLLFVGDRFEARIAVANDETILLYLPASPQWQEGQDVVLTLPASELQVWPV